jgi:acid phosphatase
MLKRYSSNFEDPFAESTMAQFDQVPGTDGGLSTSGDSPSIDRDSKYLSFSLPQYHFTLLDDSFRRSSVIINAQLHGMFFLAESQWPATPDTPAPPPELTCYRRNLFQITGSVTLPRNLRYVFTDDGSRIPIYELELAVSATESVEGNAVKIISVPWKTPAGGEGAKEDKVEREPPTIPLDKMSGQDLDTDFTTFPIQWKRLQFRIATANNGRRKELQQHFTLHLKIMANLSTGGKISIAEAHSGAVIVRGRSPRNFAARKDLPLSSSSTARKHLPGSVTRNTASSTSVPQVTSAPKMKSPPDEIPPTQIDLSRENTQETADAANWISQMTPGPSMQADTYTTQMNMNSPGMQQSIPPFTGSPTPNNLAAVTSPFPFTFPHELQATGPMSLHFASDDEGGASPYSHAAQSQSQQQQIHHHQPSNTNRRSPRPPTSNPSPNLLNRGHMNRSPRPRLHAHQVSITSVPSTTTSTSTSIPQLPNQTSSLQSQSTRQHPELHALHASSASQTAMPYKTECEPADQLYEYFPLGLDDWMPPVDAVFRPHVVHHSGPLPANPRSPGGGGAGGAGGGRHTSKRYFSEVV